MIERSGQFLPSPPFVQDLVLIIDHESLGEQHTVHRFGRFASRYLNIEHPQSV
jgi:hypothetical protein